MVAEILLIDCSASGVSGDMLLAALMDLGADERRVARAIESIPRYLDGCRWVGIRIEKVKVDGLLAKRAIIEYGDSVEHRSAKALIEAAKGCLEAEGVCGWPYEVALGALEALARAEAAVHADEAPDVHLHELGAADTVADAVGIAVALQSLGLERCKVFATHLAVGGGVVSTSHGPIPVPAPATLEMLRSAKIPFHGGPVDGELATPTGVAVLISLKAKFLPFYPQMTVHRVGYGAGTLLHGGRPSVLRVLLGESIEITSSLETVSVLETNVDDVSGELLSYAAQKLLAMGALDVQIIPSTGKKGRPSSIVMAIVERGKELGIAEAMMEELGTLGVRIYSVGRLVARRELSEVRLEMDGKHYSVRVKRSYMHDGRPLAAKPEFEDVVRVSRDTGMPVRRVMELVRKALGQ